MMALGRDGSLPTEALHILPSYTVFADENGRERGQPLTKGNGDARMTVDVPGLCRIGFEGQMTDQVRGRPAKLLEKTTFSA